VGGGKGGFPCFNLFLSVSCFFFIFFFDSGWTYGPRRAIVHYKGCDFVFSGAVDSERARGRQQRVPMALWFCFHGRRDDDAGLRVVKARTVIILDRTLATHHLYPQHNADHQEPRPRGQDDGSVDTSPRLAVRRRRARMGQRGSVSLCLR